MLSLFLGKILIRADISFHCGTRPGKKLNARNETYSMYGRQPKLEMKISAVFLYLTSVSTAKVKITKKKEWICQEM